MDEDTCGSCLYYRDVERTQNGLTEYVGVCVYEICMAVEEEERRAAKVTCVDPDFEACEDYEELL